MITVATWNVLHRIHAENWGDGELGRWPDESARIAAITARLVKRTEHVVALQEVSGDLVASLRDAMPDRTVHTFRYPRVPRPRSGTSPLRDPSEHLVLLVDGPSEEVAAESFEDDPGKGALMVRTAGTLVIATHVRADERRTRQLARLAELATKSPEGTSILLGDFNTERAAVASGLGSGFTVADLPVDGLPTRPGTSSSKSQRIDHVVVWGTGVDGAAVEDVDGLSDHNIVRATVAA
ncbi:endonuclease/exonuclease/phosphatase family protein [Solihabitans fulvus]|uniref:Endonuclease/exonuclease/phosphatase family protein n=1 Tax=Solihabitans fulvus TaxID=1892852 RepID=A0A5B2XTX2_9PSEU|nr:endonuclease/exonuclease/phosphatase family protein [Solihabitans fulvus]KAA2267127.1 endonuclease/exonuclease/phosphatase family protein [Solihabitans fulvus]